MLVAGRITEVRRLAAQLSRVSASMRQLPRAASGHDRGALQAKREKLLFRRAPIALSLVERSLTPLERLRAKDVAGPTSLTPLLSSSSEMGLLATAPAVGESRAEARSAGSKTQKQTAPRLASSVLGLLHPLYVLEGERKSLLAEKRAALERNRTRLVAGMARAAAPPSEEGRRRHRGSSRVHESEAVVALQRDVLACEEDLAMLQGSLIARPLLSARLWKHLLREEAWVGMVHAAATARSGDAGPHVRLLRALLYLSKLALGVVVEYVQGCEVNRASPRFVVSLPSAAWRARTETSARALTEAAPGAEADAAAVVVLRASADAVEADDPLMDMMLDAMAAPVASSPAPHERRVSEVEGRRASQRRGRGTDVRWLPAHASHRVLGFAHETLALLSLAIPYLDVGALVAAGKGEALLTLLVTVQQFARVVVAAQTGQVDGSPGLGADVARVLGQLQTALLESACELKDALTAVCAGAQGQAVGAGAAWSPNPGAAARFLVEMDALYLVRPGEPSSDTLIDHLVLCMFPQLRTQTYEILQQKAQSSSLLSFTTRRHRSHLYQQHTGRAGARDYLEGTVIQQARLQNRQLMAALRERRLNDIHAQGLSRLSASLTVPDLLGLFQLLVLRAHAAHESTSTATHNAEALLVCDRAVTAALFVAEALLLSGAATGTSDSADRLLSDEHTARLWLALVTLSPVVAHREAMRRATASAAGRGRRQGKTTSHAERAALTFLAEFALTELSATLADPLAAQADANGQPAQAISAGASSPELRAGTVQSLAVGLAEWGVNGRAQMVGARSAALDDCVGAALKILRKSVLQDTELWHAVRSWDVARRQDFERVLLECFQVHDLLDSVLAAAVEGMCYSSAA